MRQLPIIPRFGFGFYQKNDQKLIILGLLEAKTLDRSGMEVVFETER